MTDNNTYTLTLTRGQVVALLASGSIVDAAIGAIHHGEWVPRKEADAKLLRSYVFTFQQQNPTLERPYTELRTWLQKTEPRS